MLLSMTGYGEARRQTETLHVGVEIRTVNNRYFKLTCRGPEGFAVLESDIEKLVQSYITRGTVSVSYRLQPASADGQYVLDSTLLQSYWRQLHRLAEKVHAPTPADLGSVLQLPGVVIERQIDSDPRDVWPLLSETLTEALDRLQEFRRAEGTAMQQELSAQCRAIEGQLDNVSRCAPAVVREYRDRLAERLTELLADKQVNVEQSDLLREVSLFADRCDITEEITRLQSHLAQFQSFLQGETSQGRKLEFVSQEMFREINTIGSKANNVEIAHHVVEMKSAVEKMRELLQNVE